MYSNELNSRVIYSPVGELKDYDDVRNYMNAGAKAVSFAITTGSKRPILVLPESSKYSYASLVTLLGALKELYVVSKTWFEITRFINYNVDQIFSQFSIVKMFPKIKPEFNAWEFIWKTP